MRRADEGLFRCHLRELGIRCNMVDLDIVVDLPFLNDLAPFYVHVEQRIGLLGFMMTIFESWS